MRIKTFLTVALFLASTTALAAEAPAPAAAPEAAPAKGMGPGKGMGMGPGKGMGMGKGMRMLHPMPNMMPVVMKNTKELNLAPEQVATFKAWQAKHHPRMMAYMKQMMATRKALQYAFLDGAHHAQINLYVSRIDDMRDRIVSQKLACRQMMRDTLSPEQWAKAVTLYHRTM